MTKQEAIKLFNGAANLARAIGAHKSAISQMADGELSLNYQARVELAVIKRRAMEDAVVNK